MVKVVAIIQARLGSTRLPGKVLMNIGDMPVLSWCARATKMAPGVDEVVVATTTEVRDDEIAVWCVEWNFFHPHMPISVFRGSEADVLSRYVGAAEASGAHIILRITGDEPFVDPQVIGAVVRLQKQTGAAYCSNVSPRTFADGLDVQAFTLDALMAAHAEATRPVDRDCVCTWIERNQSRFPAATVINPIPGLQNERWVLDTAADLEFCRAIAERWPWSKGPPSQLDMLAILDRAPELRKINADHVMNERFFDSLAEEPIYARTYTRSQAQFEKARKVIPLAAQTFSKSHLQFPQPSPLFVTHGQGGLVWDVDGNEYVDLVSALLPNILGYRDPDVDVAIRRQISSGISFSLATELEAQLAETLCRLIPCAEMVRFGKTGTDATTAAVRLARAYTGIDRVLVCGGYHGWSDWSVERNLGVPEEVQNLTDRIPFGHDDLGRISGRYAAVIVEPESDPEYLQYLRAICDGRNTLLIFDEVITGFRFDLGGAQKLYGITPDLACFGKAMANGMPLSAVVGRRDIMQRMEPPDNIFYSGTFFGEALSIAASIATISKLERENVIEKLWIVGAILADNIVGLCNEHETNDAVVLHGSAPLMRLKFKDDQIAALFRREMIASGTLIIASHNICAAHRPNEIKRILKSYDHALGVVSEAIRKGDVAKRLAGASVGPMVRTAE